MSVDDAHAIVRNALEGVEEGGTSGLHEIRLADLNESERRHVVAALKDLHQLDEALAERSGHDRADIPWDEEIGGED